MISSLNSIIGAKELNVSSAIYLLNDFFRFDRAVEEVSRNRQSQFQLCRNYRYPGASASQKPRSRLRAFRNSLEIITPLDALIKVPTRSAASEHFTNKTLRNHLSLTLILAKPFKLQMQ